MRLAIPLAALLLLAACDSAPPPAASEGGSGPPPALVELARAEAGPMSHTWEAVGEVVPLGQARLAAGAAGPVSKVEVREGDRVKKGDVLLVVDPQLASAALAVAEAQVAELSVAASLAEREVNRLEGIDDDVVAASELDRAQASLEQLRGRLAAAEAQVAQAREQLRRHTLRAPFSGVITKRHVDPGDWVQMGQAALELVDVDSLEVRVEASAEVARAVKEGDVARVAGSEPVEMQVVAVVPVLSAARRTALIRLRPVGPHRLMAGMDVTAQLNVTITADGAVAIPRDALVLSPQETRVTLAVDGKAQSAVVEVIATSDTRALVRGVSPGADVVVRGNERARPGQALKVVVAEAEGSEASGE